MLEYLLFFFLKLTYDFCTVVFTMLNTHYSQKGKKNLLYCNIFIKVDSDGERGRRSVN